MSPRKLNAAVTWIPSKIWKAAGAEGEQGYKAVDQVFPFNDHYADYALRDWNQDPVKPMVAGALSLRKRTVYDIGAAGVLRL